MGESLSKFFVPLHSLPGLYDLPDQCVEGDHELAVTFGGVTQLLFLASAYGYILFQASNLIAEGSELLLLIPEIAPIVGSVVIPILGAVPDGAVVLFSGLGEKSKAQEQLSVGVGALAGSTIMLLTIPWFLSILAGRVSVIDKNGKRCQYSKPPGAGEDWKKLNPKHSNPFNSESLNNSGVEPNEGAMRSGAKTIFYTSVSYLIIQGAAFAYEDGPDVSGHEKGFALTGLVLCVVFFMGYLFQQVKNANSDTVLQDIVDAKRVAALKSGMISLQGAFFNALDEFSSGADTQLLAQEHRQQRFEAVVRKFFSQYDVNGDNAIDQEELKLLLTDLHISHTPENLEQFMKEMDTDGNGTIHFSEFVECMLRMLTQNAPGHLNASYGTDQGASRNIRELMHHHENNADQLRQSIETQRVELHNQQSEVSAAMDDEEEEEDVPEDLADLPPDQQRFYILRRAFGMMGAGTALVLLFSDPMVDVMSEIGTVCDIGPFYISFILAPLASNASELIASYSYAMKKTSKTITISLTSLEGAAIMNNTFCLGIFLALVYFRGLEWRFSAETISILFVEFAMVFAASRKIQTLRLGLFVVSLFPLSLLLVMVLENVFGLD